MTMSASATRNRTEITLHHPEGSIRLAAPTDVPLVELIPDFLDVTGQPDRDRWVVSADGANPYPSDTTIAELGADVPPTVLVLHEAPATPPPSAANIPEPPPAATVTEEPPAATVTAPRPADSVHAPAATPASTRDERPLSELTARTLPAKLSRPARSWLAVKAAASAAPGSEQPEPPAPGTLGPATFTRTARVSPLARMREAWRSTEYEQRLDQRVLGLRLRRCATIAVVSPKGGVGKTTVTALLGSLLAFLRRDRVVAVETNPDWGSLGRRLVPDHPIFIDDLLKGPLGDGQLSPTQLDAQLGRGPDGLMVAPAPTDPQRAQKLDEAAYRTLFARLSELVGTLVLDCGTGLDDPPARAALACADQLVLVCDDEPDTASIVSEAAEWLQRIEPPLVLVVNNVRRSSRIEVAALEREMSFARGLAVIPRDERAAGRLHGSRYSWNQAPARWQTPVRELAAQLASDWRRLDIAH
jgi:MinD-like ATPase involved in chromosome partitioning or flagellar assembly